MANGQTLVKRHFDSMTTKRPQDFEEQLAASYRYEFLPPIMGQGPVQARRWCDLLFSIYRVWRYEIEDADESGSETIVRARFFGLEPVEPYNTPPYFEDSCVMQFTVRGELLTACRAVCLPFEAHALDSEYADFS